MVECQADSGKGDGSRMTKMLPIFEPHQILRYLMSIGLRVDRNDIKSYWTHLESVGSAWAKQVNDHSLIPTLVKLNHVSNSQGV